MEGTTHQHVHAWQMALWRHAPDLPQVEALAPVFFDGGERSDIDRLPSARGMEVGLFLSTSLTEATESAGSGKSGTTKNAYYGFFTTANSNTYRYSALSTSLHIAYFPPSWSRVGPNISRTET